VAEGIEKPEGTIAHVTYGQTGAAPPGSESMACTKSRGVNVGDPPRSSRDGSIGTKPNQREYRNDAEEVRWVIVPGKRGNARGGKDPGQHHPGRGHVVRPAESQTTTATQLTRIAWLSARDTQKTFQSLMHHFNETSLKACFHQLDGRKAVGVDGVTKAAYAQHLDDNLTDLVARMKRMAYRPGPVRQVLIPKAGAPHATRPLGISNREDKVVQLLMHRVLESIYEPLFLDCSYGFRPGRGCHEALRALHQHLYRKEVETIIDLDIANYFGTIDHDLLEAILREKIQDERFLRYVKRMFKAGVLTAGELTVSEEGVAQGSCCSPILANIFAHHVLDTWFEAVVKAHCRGQVALYR
jgi:RNA-directed DNA polymerase